MNANQTESENLPPAPQPRARLRMQPLAPDRFTTFVYVCVVLLLISEFVALFWLDIFA